MVRLTGKKMITIEGIVFYTHRTQEEGLCPMMDGHTGRTRLVKRVRGQGKMWNLWERTFIVVAVGRNTQGKVNRLTIG